MLRITKVENIVYNYSNSLDKQDILNNSSLGISSIDISKKLNILRNNASSDLNKLYKLGKIIKIKGKPTKYFHRSIFENIFGIFLSEIEIECSSINDLLNKDEQFSNSCTKSTHYNNKISLLDPFSNLIGYNDSLTNIVNVAKSAILYPNGLHTLLVGESGVGKSLFAELMYEYGLINKIFKSNSSFITFNCADYANNPNLLVTQLFGCKKGAYTGADSNKEGLIEKANGGVLFLDEIHRLPPEGQEMLFLFIDKSKFRRLGETSCERTSNVFIIAATTEDPNSSLLTTFIRRIPSIIKIPNFKERSIKEKLEIINTLYILESKKIKKELLIDKKCILKLLSYNPPGNIGQLSSDIKLSVARGYFESKLNNLDKVTIKEINLPIYNSNSNLDIKTRKSIESLLIDNFYILKPSSKIDANYLSLNKYDYIKQYINEISTASEESSIKELFKNYTKRIEKDIFLQNLYPDFINDEVNEIVNILSEMLYKDINLILDKSSYIALALYFKNLNDRTLTDESIRNTHDKYISNKITNLSKKIIQILERKFNIQCTNSDINTLSVIINSLENKEIFDAVGIIVAAHGSSTASDIASVANELLGVNFAIPIDMPLTDPPNKLLDTIIDKINSNTFSRGVIIFADMGSLTTFDSIIKEKTCKEVFTIDSLNILLIIESIRKSIFLKSDLYDILYDIKKSNMNLTLNLNRKIENFLCIKRSKIIYTLCNSGEGSALYLKYNIDNILKENNIYNVEVVPLNLENKKQLRDIISKTSIDKEIIAIVGSINPSLNNIPFISLEDILLHNGMEKLIYLIDSKLINTTTKNSINTLNKEIVINITCDAVNKYLNILSAEKIKEYILEFINNIEDLNKIHIDISNLTKLFIHLSCMIERILLNEFVLTPNENFDVYKKKHLKLLNLIKKSINCIERNLNISIPDNELYYICEIIKSNENKVII